MNGRTTTTAEAQRFQDDQLAKAILTDMRERETARYHRRLCTTSRRARIMN